MAKLIEYHKKRDFKKTTEPAGEEGISKLKRPIYLIQKHDARNLHYDFRLEVGGVLKSWAVPKGPSTDPDVKRLAIETEDHPLAYADFEGVIPEGEYGAGEVIIWDRGTYKNIKKMSAEDQYRSGQIEVNLEGKKLKGGFVLIKTGRGWLLKKMEDGEADAKRNILDKSESVKSGVTIEKLKKKNEKRESR